MARRAAHKNSSIAHGGALADERPLLCGIRVPTPQCFLLLARALSLAGSPAVVAWGETRRKDRNATKFLMYKQRKLNRAGKAMLFGSTACSLLPMHHLVPSVQADPSSLGLCSTHCHAIRIPYPKACLLHKLAMRHLRSKPSNARHVQRRKKGCQRRANWGFRCGKSSHTGLLQHAPAARLLLLFQQVDSRGDVVHYPLERILQPLGCHRAARHDAPVPTAQAAQVQHLQTRAPHLARAAGRGRWPRLGHSRSQPADRLRRTGLTAP